jgi:hypothetical protein
MICKLFVNDGYNEDHGGTGTLLPDISFIV